MLPKSLITSNYSKIIVKQITNIGWYGIRTLLPFLFLYANIEYPGQVG
jgi:hypothetical protein